MSYAAISAALYSALDGISGSGNVHIGERWLRDPSRLADVFGVVGELDEMNREALRGWVIARDAISESHWTQTRTLSAQRWILRGVQGLVDSATSEASWQARVDDVWAVLRALPTVGGAEYMTAAATPTIEPVVIADRLCHMAEIELTVTEQHTIGDETQPSGSDGTMDSREGYADTAGQLAGYLASDSGAWLVHNERLWKINREDAIDSFTVAAPTLGEGKRLVRAWQLWRASDTESRGIGQRIETEQEWRIQGAWSWRDSASSYAAFQAHVDTIRGRFRAVQNLGSVDNPTAVISSPLQVEEIGARSLMGIMTHFADCVVNVTGVVHA